MLVDLKIADVYDGFLFLAESARNPPSLQSHHHVELELNFVVRGAITYVIRGRRYTFQAGTILWIFPAQEHQLVNRSDDAQYYVAVFKPSLIKRACRTPAYEGLKLAGRGLKIVKHTQLDPESSDLIRKTMESIMQGSIDADILNREGGYGVNSSFAFEHRDPDGLNAGLQYILLLAWRSHTQGRAIGHPVPLHPCVKRALSLMAEADVDYDLTTLARKCGVSESYFSRTFQRQLGVTLTRYRNSLRLARFWQCYRQGSQKTVSEAVYEAGFGSYAQFYKVFVQHYGRGPRNSLIRGGRSDGLVDHPRLGDVSL